MVDDCLFCKIVSGVVPCIKVFEDNDILAFNDIEPKAPVHILIIPKKHYATLNDFPLTELPLVAKMVKLVQKLSREMAVDATGYRTTINTNKDAGQTVFHVHLHMIGGKPLGTMA